MSDKENQIVQLELAVLIGGGLIVPVVTALFFPAIPKNLRVPVGLGIGILVILAAILYVARILRREISGRNEDLLRTLAAGRVDEIAGKMWRGSITNVTLRSATIHTLVDRLIRDVPVTRREAALMRPGAKSAPVGARTSTPSVAERVWTSGQTWSRRFHCGPAMTPTWAWVATSLTWDQAELAR